MASVIPADVANVLNRTLTPEQEQIAEDIIAGLEGELEAHMGKRLDVGTFTHTAKLDGGAFQVFLPNRPVVGLASVTVDGVAQSTEGITVHSWGLTGSTVGPGSAVFTYTAGINGAGDKNVRGLILGAAARVMAAVLADTVGLKSHSVEGTRYDFVGGGEWGFTEAELKKVKGRRKVGVA